MPELVDPNRWSLLIYGALAWKSTGSLSDVLTACIALFTKGSVHLSLPGPYASLFCTGYAFRVTWSERVSRPFASDTSSTCIDREGLGKRRIGTATSLIEGLGHSVLDFLSKKVIETFTQISSAQAPPDNHSVAARQFSRQKESQTKGNKGRVKTFTRAIHRNFSSLFSTIR